MIIGLIIRPRSHGIKDSPIVRVLGLMMMAKDS